MPRHTPRDRVILIEQELSGDEFDNVHIGAFWAIFHKQERGSRRAPVR
jgi:hypothetical protein